MPDASQTEADMLAEEEAWLDRLEDAARRRAVVAPGQPAADPDVAAEAAPMEDHAANVAAAEDYTLAAVDIEDPAHVAAERHAAALTIDAWTERVALAADRAAESIRRHGFLPEEVPRPVIAVNPADEAAMRRAHSASPTDGPLHLFLMRVVADEHVPARTARLRYDVEVPL